MRAKENRREKFSRAIAEVRGVYAELETRPKARNCQRLTNCCQFHLTGRVPHLTKGEALAAAQGLRASGRKNLPVESDGRCPLLDPRTAKCLIYADRPFGCRTHFCAAAGGPLSRREVIDLIRRLESVDAQLGGDGARLLPAAIKVALNDLA